MVLIIISNSLAEKLVRKFTLQEYVCAKCFVFVPVRQKIVMSVFSFFNAAMIDFAAPPLPKIATRFFLSWTLFGNEFLNPIPSKLSP